MLVVKRNWGIDGEFTFLELMNLIFLIEDEHILLFTFELSTGWGQEEKISWQPDKFNPKQIKKSLTYFWMKNWRSSLIT